MPVQQIRMVVFKGGTNSDIVITDAYVKTWQTMLIGN